jgi:outer membrane protein assembly factor BamB
MMWRDRSVGKGSVTFEDGELHIQSEDNIAGLAEASPSGYREKERFDIPDKGAPSWADSVISDGRLCMRK